MDKNILIESLNNFKPQFIQKLKNVYGNSHDTMIGYFVDWWLENNLDDHFVIQNTPSITILSEEFKKIFKTDDIKRELAFSKNTVISTKNKKVTCDALFCAEDKIMGLLEVEGTKPIYILEKVAEYFKQSKVTVENKEKDNKRKIHIDYSHLEFAIVIFYPTGLVGRTLMKYPKKATHYVDKKKLNFTLDRVLESMKDNQQLILIEIQKKERLDEARLPKGPVIKGLDTVYYALQNSNFNLEIMDSETKISDDFIESLCLNQEKER